MRSEFRDFVAYTRATELANDLHFAVEKWASFARWTVGTQLMRAIDSVGANIAEASGRRAPADKRRLLIIARGSLYETEHWLVTAYERRLLGAENLDRLDEIARTLSGLIRRQRDALQ